MIAIWNSVTGEVQFVTSAEGYGEEWTVIADPAPADIMSESYTVIEGDLVPDLAAARARQRAIINAARDAAQDGGADTPHGRFDSAGRSREFLNGAVMAATLAGMNQQAFSLAWTLADNSVVTLTGAQIVESGLAVAAHVDAMHQRARVLKARIDVAATLAEIRAVTWTLADPT